MSPLPMYINRDSSVSVGSQNFNCSPSNIFNKKNSNTSLVFLNSQIGQKPPGANIGKISATKASEKDK